MDASPPLSLQLSPSALQEFQRLTRKHAHPLVTLGLAPGDCAEFVYQVQIGSLDRDGEARADWPQTTIETVTIAIEPAHLDRLNGLAIDYSEDLMGGSFRFENPNATRTCSCGSAFDL